MGANDGNRLGFVVGRFVGVRLGVVERVTKIFCKKTTIINAITFISKYVNTLKCQKCVNPTDKQ